MSPEFDPKATYEAYAPLHWDAKEWEYWVRSEDNESLTDGEDLQFLLDGELEDEDDVDDVSGKGTTPPQKRRTTMSRPRKTRRQEACCAPGRPMKTTMKTTTGTPMTESMAMMASPATMALETMAAAAMMVVMLARFP
jgi:hypothetical protein